jgi:N-methylhydantoinase B
MAEGLLIPPLHLHRAGQPNDGVIALLLANVRLSEQVWGDLEAQIAANAVCRRRASEVLDDTHQADFAELSAAVLATADRAMRQAITAVPDGTYRSVTDADGVAGQPTRIECAVTVDGDEISIDYEGSSPQVRYAVNCTLNYTTAYSIYPLKILLDPFTRSNYGSYQSISVTAPAGSILNPTAGAPVLARHLTGHLLCCAVYRALADVLPERVIADSGGSPALRVQFSGRTASDEKFALLLFASAGMGASAHHDGLATTAFPTNSGGGSIEALEASAPLLITKKEFRADSGGAGTHRGGLGQDIEVRNLTGTPLSVVLLGDRAEHPALGIHGGGPGEVARVLDDTGTALPLKSVTALPAGAGLALSFAGGGGYGPPAGREVAAIAADLRDGFITRDAAVRHYGQDAVAAATAGD